MANASDLRRLHAKAVTFKGGIHPAEMKEITENLPIRDFMEPNELMVFPMIQHVGAPCKPIVKKGDYVLRDQLIGEPQGLGANIYTSVSGTVKDVKEMLHPNGNMVMSVVIENDHQYTTLKHEYEPASYEELSKEEILARIKFAGIVGMGGAGFPTHVKLSPPPDKKIEYILLNASECEPYLTSDYRVLLEDSWRVVNGFKIALSLFDDAVGRICIENNKMKAVEVIGELVQDEPKIEVTVLKTKFPEGSEKQLINAATGREVPSGKLPADAGCIVINVDTAVAISRAVTQGRPLERRIVTVAGDCIPNPGNYKVRIGTSVRELIESQGELLKQPKKIIFGGPMMGMAVDTLDLPVTKTTSCILLLSEDEVALSPESPCIRCGKCIEACPMHLQPYLLNQLVLKRDTEGFMKYHGMDCMECGSCSYICPAKRQLTQSFRAGKRLAQALIRAKKEQEAKKA